MPFIFPIETQDQRAVIVCSVVFSLLAVVSVALRVLARRRANRVLDWSDYFVIAACVCCESSILASMKTWPETFDHY